MNLLSAERAGLARRKEQLEAELETHKALARRELNRKLRQVRGRAGPGGGGARGAAPGAGPVSFTAGP